MKIRTISTPIGALKATADEHYIYQIVFDETEQKHDDQSLLLDQLETELQEYLAKKRTVFEVPLCPQGTEFQKAAWRRLQEVPYGTTLSYHAQSNGKATRAVANANGKNPCVIVIPCHRIIRKNGQLGGFVFGLERKRWLLEHEKQG